MLHVDTREPVELRGSRYNDVNGRPGLIEKVLGASQVLVRKMDSGDYAVFDKDGHSLGIERKCGADFTSSLSNTSRRKTDGNIRLYSQLERMKLEYTHSALLLEGPLEYVPDEEKGKGGWWGLSGWGWLSIQMLLWKWQQDGLFVFFTPNKDATIDLLRGLNDRANRGCVLTGKVIK